MEFKSINKLVLSALVLSSSMSAFANNLLIGAPDRCPSIESLRSVEFDSTELSEAFPGMWYVMQLNKFYDTNASWDFAILVVAKDEKGSFERAKEALVTLSPAPGPRRLDSTLWMCEYQLPSGPEAVAFSHGSTG